MASTHFPYHASGNATERFDVHVPLSYYNPLIPYPYPQYEIKKYGISNSKPFFKKAMSKTST